MVRLAGFALATLAALAALSACSTDDPAGPSGLVAFVPAVSQSAPRRAGAASIVADGQTLQLYPFTLVNFSDAPADRFDPSTSSSPARQTRGRSAPACSRWTATGPAFRRPTC